MKVLFWCVDIQKDFMLPQGKLYIKDAEKIIPQLSVLDFYASQCGIKVIYTMDWHNSCTEEISDKPDFVNTFPEHCMACTEGAGLVISPVEFDDNWIKKDYFDVFKDSDEVEELLGQEAPDYIAVYGVATNVCVNFAIQGMLQRGYKVIAVEDAMKGLSEEGEKKVKENWKSKGVLFTITKELPILLNELENDKS